MTLIATKFVERDKVFHETLETMTLELWLLHGLDVKIGATGKCQGKFLRVDYFRMENGQMKQFLYMSKIKCFQELKPDSVTIVVEDNLFKITVEKAVRQLWSELPYNYNKLSYDEDMKHPDAQIFNN